MSPVLKTAYLGSLCLCVLAAGRAGAEGTLPTADEIKVLQAKYQSERDHVVKAGIVKRFLPVVLDKAEELARRGATALQAGRLLQAGEAYRQARWQLPYQSAHVPDHVSRILGSMRLRHTHEILGVAFSPDGTKLATASADHAVKIWDLGNGHELLSYNGHTDKVRCLAFSPDGKSIASGGAEKEIKIWDPATGKDLVNIKGEGVYATSLVFARDGKYLIAGHAGTPGQTPGLLAIYETANGNLKRAITDFRATVMSVALNVDGSILAAGVGDGQLRLWKYPAVVEDPTKPEYWSRQDPNGATYQVAFSPDNRTLARIGADGIQLYNVAIEGSPFQYSSPRRTIPQPPPPNRYLCAVFSKDSKSLFTGSVDGLVKMWDSETGQQTGAFKGHGGEVKALAFDPAGSQLASASGDFTVRLWDFAVVQQARDFAGHEAPVWSSAFSPDGTRIVSASADRTVRVWDVASGKTLHTLKGHTGAVTAALFSSKGTTILSGAGDKTLRLWDALTGQALRSFTGHTAAITALDYSRDGLRIASGSADKTVRIWDAATAMSLVTIDDVKSIVAAVAFSPNGKQLAVGRVDQTIRLYDAETGKEQASWPAHGIAVSGLAYSPDGKWLASCGADHLVRIWPLANPGQHSLKLEGHTGPVSAVAFRADGKYLVSTGSDQTVKLWKFDAGDPKEAQTYRGHRDWVTSASFSGDGYYVVSSGVDGLVKVWEITSKEVPIQAEHTGSVYAVAYSPDGKAIATGATDKLIKVWDRATGAERFTLQGHTDAIAMVGFTPDSKTLISSSIDRNIRLWDMETGKERPLVPGQQQSFTGFKIPVPYFVVSPDGKKLVIWEPRDRGTIITAFDLATGTELYSVNDPSRSINAVAFSADAKRVATGARDGSVRILDLEKKGTTLPGGDWFMYDQGVGMGDLAFTPDGSILVAGSTAGDIKICKVANKEVLKTIPKAHKSRIIACQVSPDGKRFATIGETNIIKLWDIATGEELRSWDLHTVSLDRSVAFSPDGKQMVAGNTNTTVFVLDLP